MTRQTLIQQPGGLLSVECGPPLDLDVDLTRSSRKADSTQTLFVGRKHRPDVT